MDNQFSITIRFHVVAIVPMVPFIPKSTSKSRSVVHFTYSMIILPCFIPYR